MNERLVDGVHDVSDGGLAVALAEMAVKSGTGCRVNGISGIKELFGEGPSRVVLSVPPVNVGPVAAQANAADVPIAQLGVAGGDHFIVEDLDRSRAWPRLRKPGKRRCQQHFLFFSGGLRQSG